MENHTINVPGAQEFARPRSRRDFFKSLAVAGAGATAASMLLSGKASAQTDDVDIANFALTLEYLEADFYDQALDSGLLMGELRELAAAFGETEQAHVEALEAVASQLGEPVDPPRTDFSEALVGLDPLLMALAQVENVGAAAYLGAAPSIQDRELLAAALSIHSVEARHAAALNELIGISFVGDAPLTGSVPDGAFASPMTMQEVLDRIQPFLAS